MAIMNQKGGCGKTTTAINLSACLAELECEVLLMDLDPQGHSSLGLGVTAEQHRKGMYEALTRESTLEEVIHPVRTNLDLAPGGITLAAIEQRLAGTNQRESQVQLIVSQMKRYYDYILLDCPPSLGLLTINALMASSEVLVPLEAGVFSLHGMGQLLETIDLVKTRGQRTLKVRVLTTLYDGRTNHSKAILGQVTETFGDLLLKTIIRQTVRLREAAREGLPITEYDRTSRGYEDYTALAREIIAMEEQTILPKIPEQDFLDTIEQVVKRS
ncbi:MAG: ParA family protein [Nitrospira sp.]|nr:ParA family protein [Nitrospira sp.]